MLFLSGMIAVIILRTIHRDITKCPDLQKAGCELQTCK